ncbi:MAG: ligase-associated DNA damage response endonuclease PdeM [Wenzhouxiangella sp.]|nr:MAG: ligase-associated DNA damage response endonuclease PdeM [Wenzhouxiangella sp.]
MEVRLGPHKMILLPERAAWWPARRALLLADVHLGKDQVFRSQGLAVPAGVMEQDLGRIDALLEQTGAELLLILGDWVHAPPAAGDAWPDRIRSWRTGHSSLHIDLVLGNHDRDLSAWLPQWGIQARSEPYGLDGLNLVHAWQAELAGPGVSGHLHPGVVIRNGRDRARLPAFLESADHLILPAFGRFTGLDDQPRFPAGRRYVIAGQRVLAVP